MSDNNFKLRNGGGCLCCHGCGRQDRQLNTYDWLADIPGNNEDQEMVEVQFKNTRKGYFRNSNHLKLAKGDIVAEERKDVFPVAVYDVICNDNGEVLTDLKLLKSLSDFIFHKPVPVMVTKKAQVSIATFLPESKEEFAKLPGCGEKLYNKCGEMIMHFVKEYLINKQ